MLIDKKSVANACNKTEMQTVQKRHTHHSFAGLHDALLKFIQSHSSSKH